MNSPQLQQTVLGGVAYASLNYRLLAEVDKEGVIKPLTDCKRALQFIRYHAAELNIDPVRLVPILHYDGTPITARFIAGAISDRLDALKVTPLRKAVS